MSDAPPGEKDKKPVSRKPGAKVLAVLLAKQAQALSPLWAPLLGGTATFAAPTVSEVPAGGLAKLLAFPAAAVPLAVGGGFQGRLLVLLSAADAAVLAVAAGRPAPAEGSVDAEGLGALLALFCAQAAAVFHKEKGAEVTVAAEAAKPLADAEKLPETNVAGDGWLADAKLALAEGKSVQVRLLVPLDLGSALADAHKPPAAGPAAVKPAKGTILVVDDQHSLRTLIRRLLTNEGYLVVECPNGDEALQYLASKKDKPTAVILDVMMPGLDGLEVCRRLRTLPACDKLPVIMCTGKGQKRDVMEALQAGANDYIVKPFNREILVAKLGKVLGTAT